MTRGSVLATLVIMPAALAVIAAMYAGKASEMSISPRSIKKSGYCLLTWSNKFDDVCFAIVPKDKSEQYMHNWFAKWDGKCGIALLREELSALPSGEYVEWRNSPPKFTYPQRRVSDELFDFAKSKGLDFRMNPVIDKRMFPDWP